MQDAQPNAGESTWTRASILLAQILVPGALVLVGLVLSKPYSRWLIAALAVGFAVIASTVVALLLSRYYMLRMEGLISTRLAGITQAAFMQPGGRDGWTQEQLSVLESEIEVETILIVGDNFDSEVTSEAPFLDVVRRNIHKRGIDYVYIARDDPTLRHQFKGLRVELGVEEDDERFTTWFLPEEIWQQGPYTVGNFTIYDPSRTSPSGYSWDPGGDGESFIRLLPQVALDWVAKIEELCPELSVGRRDTAEERV